MSRPTQDTIDAGALSWDAPVNDNFTKLFGGPLPVYRAATVAALLAVDPTLYEDCLATTLDTREVWKSDGTEWRLLGTGTIEANGARSYRVVVTSLRTMPGDQTWAGVRPAGAVDLGVSGRVTTTITSGDGATDFDVGDGVDPNRYAATQALAAGTDFDLTNATADPTGWHAAAGDVVITPNGGTFTGGVVRVVVAYDVLTAPTS